MFETRVNGQHVNPPSSTTRFIVRDMGDANPRLMRSSLNAVPATNDMLNNSGMQFALTVQPLALLDPAEDQTQVTHWDAACIDVDCHDTELVHAVDLQPPRALASLGGPPTGWEWVCSNNSA